MRIFPVLLLVLLFIQPALSQAPLKTQKPAKNQMQAQMAEAINELNKQIADLEKQLAEAIRNKEDEATIKDLRGQIAMLKKQVTMMGGVNKSLSGVSEKTFQQAGEEEALVPKKDIARLSMLPKKILTAPELAVFLKSVHAQIEKTIPAVERTEALKMFSEIKEEHKSVVVTGNAATGYWMLGHWEKALFIIGKVCIEDLSNSDNLNNYASFLIATGGEQAALPILLYLDNNYPGNSTIKNNLGQAWFGLGDMENAKRNLDSATLLYSNHSMANSTLSTIYEAEGDKEKAISFLQASLKGSYDPEKDARLARLGYNVKFADLPALNYPIQEDPFGLIPLIKSWNPDKIQSSIADEGNAYAMQRYLNGVTAFANNLSDENETLNQKLKTRDEKISQDSSYRHEFLEAHNSPAYLLAARSIQLACIEMQSRCGVNTSPGAPFILTALWLPYTKPDRELDDLYSINALRYDCEEVWFNEVTVAMQRLDQALQREGTSDGELDCSWYNQRLNAYLAKRKEIYSRGVKLIQNEFIRKSPKLTEWIKTSLYSGLDDPPKTIDDLSYYLISNTEYTIRKRRFQNDVYAAVLDMIDEAQKFQSRYQSYCESRPDVPQGLENLLPYKKTKVECVYLKRIATPVRFYFELKCHTITEKTNPRIKKRKTDVPKGAAENANPSFRDVIGPLQQALRGGTKNYSFKPDIAPGMHTGPLTPEKKNPSQFSLEYNRLGNLVGFNFQLNNEGTNLKDAESVESGIDSRWSWNALGSAKKGFFNKLLVK